MTGTRFTASLLALASLVSVWLVATVAGAHPANLSRTDLTVDGSAVRGLVVFAKRDAMRLGNMDPNGDGTVTESELRASQATFRTLVEREMEVTVDGARCTPKLEGGGDVEGDGFGLSVSFACPYTAKRVHVSLDVLRRLPPEHRDFFRIQAGEGDPQKVETVLTSTNVAVDWGAAAASGPPAGIVSAVELGIEHILTGWDHLLFLFALLLGTRGTRAVVLAISAFTVAHSITLALAALDVVAVSPRVVEPAIAASISYVAFENVWRPGAPHRWRRTFAFGLIHGLGFAGALRELAITRDRLVPTLFGFNLGVEAGQLLVVLAMLPALALVTKASARAERYVRLTSIAVGVVGLALFVQRLIWAS